MVIAQQMAEIPSRYTRRRSLQLFDSERIDRSRIYVCGIERTQCEESVKLTDVNDSIDRSPESPNAFDAPSDGLDNCRGAAARYHRSFIKLNSSTR